MEEKALKKTKAGFSGNPASSLIILPIVFFFAMQYDFLFNLKCFRDNIFLLSIQIMVLLFLHRFQCELQIHWNCILFLRLLRTGLHFVSYFLVALYYCLVGHRTQLVNDPIIVRSIPWTDLLVAIKWNLLFISSYHGTLYWGTGELCQDNDQGAGK